LPHARLALCPFALSPAQLLITGIGLTLQGWWGLAAPYQQVVFCTRLYDKLHHTFRLDRERPHELSGLQARLAAKIALHNFCIWLNEQLGRPRLAFTDLVDW
jgi:hypothetical protein